MSIRFQNRSPLKTPLLAGGGAAVFCILAVTVTTLVSQSSPPEIGASAYLPVDEEVPAETVIFAQSESDEEIALPGLDIEPEEAEPAPDRSETQPPVRQVGQSLVIAPIDGLFEQGPGGPLPILDSNGLRPADAYARPFDGDAASPAISVIVGGLGLNSAYTQAAIDQLPADVTLAFVPYARDLQSWINRARADGHEVLLELPMEPFDYPNNDPGPHTLLAEASPADNKQKLEWLLSRAAGYTGVINYLGNRLGGVEDPLTAIFGELEGRGLTVFHDGSGRRGVIQSAATNTEADLALVDRVIDANPFPDPIQNRLLELEALSLQNGQSLGFASPFPASIEAIADWASGLESRGYQLAPASWLAEQVNSVSEESAEAET